MPEPKHIHHLLVVEDDKGRREYCLEAPLYSVGRDPKCDIRLMSQFVSRRHATLVQLTNDDGYTYYRIIDGNAKGRMSENGIIINGRKLQAHDLQHEDEIVFGPKVRASYLVLRRQKDEDGGEGSYPTPRRPLSPTSPAAATFLEKCLGDSPP